jgi:hypothetical protein
LPVLAVHCRQQPAWPGTKEETTVLRTRSDLLILLALFGAVGCTHNVMPKISPAKVPAVHPPIQSHALLLITTSFQSYTTQSSSGIHSYNYHLGESVAAALDDMIRESFVRAETRHVGDAEVLQWLSAPADTSVADVLLVPYFESGGFQERAVNMVADARLRMDVRSLRTGQTLSLTATGRSARAFSSLKGLTGTALEVALRSLSDSLAAHRGELEVASR